MVNRFYSVYKKYHVVAEPRILYFIIILESNGFLEENRIPTPRKNMENTPFYVSMILTL